MIRQDSSSIGANTFFGEWLVSNDILNEEKLHEALAEQQNNGGRLGEVLVRLEIFEDSDLARYLGEYFSLDHVRIDGSSDIDMVVARKIPEKIAKRFNLVALGETEDRIIIAMVDPLDVVALDTVTRIMKRQPDVVVCSQMDINRAIEAIYYGSDIEEQRLRELVDFEINSEEEYLIEEDDLMSADIISSEDAASRAPVIKFVDLLLSQAVKSKASDIHIEPQERSMNVRMRVDGLLSNMIPPPRKMQGPVITRVKILANMDVAERRLPQDGRFKIKAPGRDIDVRVSTLPTIYGEKVVMRILDKNAVKHDINVLGFDPEFVVLYKNVLRQPHGIIILTGPTGSGKSTTLYASLNYLKDPHKNITTVEDPVEYRLAGINQVQIRPEINLGFAACLRSIMRQDPDIVLLGEIRDKETAEIAVQTSLTGHLVLSTFHTNDASSAITRLMFMGVEPYLLASSLNLVISQRLVRRICESCKEPMQLEDRFIGQINIDAEKARQTTFYRGRGCAHCGETGYQGRLPLFEFLLIDRQIRQAIIAGADDLQIKAMARQAGYETLLECGTKKVIAGYTTPEEVLKVTYSEDINL